MTTAGIVEAARRAGRTLLSEVESKQLLEEAGIPVVPTRLATSRAEAVRIAQEIGLPAVLKVVSPDITHKSDVGGVKVGLETAGTGTLRLRLHHVIRKRGRAHGLDRRRVRAEHGGAGRRGDRGGHARPAVRACGDVRPGRRARRDAARRFHAAGAGGPAGRPRHDSGDQGPAAPARAIASMLPAT